MVQKFYAIIDNFEGNTKRKKTYQAIQQIIITNISFVEKIRKKKQTSERIKKNDLKKKINKL